MEHSRTTETYPFQCNILGTGRIIEVRRRVGENLYELTLTLEADTCQFIPTRAKVFRGDGPGWEACEALGAFAAMYGET